MLKERLLVDPQVASFRVVKERIAGSDGYLRGQITFTNSTRLEFAEYIRRNQHEVIEVITYSYHWADASGVCIQRWDNTPHFPGLANFPHHIHIGSEEAPQPGKPVTLQLVLAEIFTRINED